MWFHVSKTYLGDNPILQPKLPRNGFWPIIMEEGNIPRVCVSNSLFHCLLAIHGTEYLKSVTWSLRRILVYTSLRKLLIFRHVAVISDRMEKCGLSRKHNSSILPG
jgi:hypothetical protein